jgi:hypothetical protein
MPIDRKFATVFLPALILVPGLSRARAQVNVDTGYVRFQVPAGWKIGLSPDKMLVHLSHAGSGVMIDVVMDKDLPTGLTQLGSRLEAEALRYVSRYIPPDSIGSPSTARIPRRTGCPSGPMSNAT